MAGIGAPALAARAFPSSLRQPSSAASTCVNERQDGGLGQRLLHLGVPENDLSRLVGKGEGAKRGFRQQPVDQICKVGRGLGLRLQRAGKDIPFGGLGHNIVGGGEPDAPARQLLLQVGDDNAVGAEHEADQVVPGTAGARERAAADRVSRCKLLYVFLLRRRFPQILELLAGS